MSGETRYLPLNMQVLKGVSLREVYCCPHPQLESPDQRFYLGVWGREEAGPKTDSSNLLKELTSFSIELETLKQGYFQKQQGLW